MLCDSEPKSFEQLSLDSFLPKNEVHLFCIYCSMLPDTDPALRGTSCTVAVKDRSFFTSLNYFCFRFSSKI